MPDLSPPPVRVGIGADIHRLETGRNLVLGGVTIPFDRGLAGHSDGDVLTHAIIDALLGAAALGDIGSHFPSSDGRWKGISSLALLRKVMALLKEKGYEVMNVDATVVAERPRLAEWIREMVEAIAPIMEVAGDRVSIKATTAKEVGPVGAGEAISAVSIAMIREAERAT